MGGTVGATPRSSTRRRIALSRQRQLSDNSGGVSERRATGRHLANVVRPIGLDAPKHSAGCPSRSIGVEASHALTSILTSRLGAPAAIPSFP